MIEAFRQSPEDEDRPQPDIKKLGDMLEGPLGIRSLALTGLFVLAAFYTLYFARSFFLPIILALLLSFLLTPVVRFLKRLRLPGALAAALVVFGFVGGVGFGFYELSGPAYEWAEKAPQTMRRIERKLREFKKPVQTMSRATAQVEKMTEVGGGSAPTPTVEVQHGEPGGADVQPGHRAGGGRGGDVHPAVLPARLRGPLPAQADPRAAQPGGQETRGRDRAPDREGHLRLPADHHRDQRRGRPGPLGGARLPGRAQPAALGGAGVRDQLHPLPGGDRHDRGAGRGGVPHLPTTPRPR